MSAPTPSFDNETLVIQGVRVIDPVQAFDEVTHVVVREGRIAGFARSGELEALGEGRVRHIAGHGKILLPGLVELRAHLGEPGFEYREDLDSGLRAAAAGGFVHVCSQPDTSPVNDRRSVTEALRARAAHLGLATLHPLAASTVGLAGEQLSEIGDLLDGGALAVSSARKYIKNSALMRRLLEYCTSFDALVLQQPQDPSLVGEAVVHEGAISARLGLVGWARAAEEIALARDLALCGGTRARYHACSLTTAEAVALLRHALDRNPRLSADVTPAHLLLTDSDVQGYDPRYRLEPPLREQHDQAALLAALNSGVIACISSDHRPNSALETQCEFDQALPGATGLELCLSLVWTLVKRGQLQAQRAVEALSTAPARVLGLEPPSLRVGQMASFTLFDPDTTWVPDSSSLLSKGKNSPWWGRPLTGRVQLTVHQGRPIFELSPTSPSSAVVGATQPKKY